MSFVVLDTDAASYLFRGRVDETFTRHMLGSQLRGRPRPANDTWIAACCLVRELPLITYNRKDYEDFADHEGLTLLPV